MQKKLFSVLVMVSLAAPMFVGAQTSTREFTRESNGGGAEVRNSAREGAQKEKQTSTQGESKDVTKEERGNFAAQAEAAHARFQKEVESARESAKRQLEVKREEAKKVIEGIKDERKKETVKRIDQNLNEMNVRMVERYSANMEQLDKVLVNIVARTDRAAAQGLSVAPVRVAIATASSSIAAARAAIVVQSGKTYAAVLASSTTARTDLSAIRDQLKSDLRMVETKVKSARDAVHAAATTLASVRGIGETEPRATSTATTTTTSTTTSTATTTQ